MDVQKLLMKKWASSYQFTINRSSHHCLWCSRSMNLSKTKKIPRQNINHGVSGSGIAIEEKLEAWVGLEWDKEQLKTWISISRKTILVLSSPRVKRSLSCGSPFLFAQVQVSAGRIIRETKTKHPVHWWVSVWLKRKLINGASRTRDSKGEVQV